MQKFVVCIYYYYYYFTSIFFDKLKDFDLYNFFLFYFYKKSANCCYIHYVFRKTILIVFILTTIKKRLFCSSL